eukprot:3339448-Ditylum_brightwellii.AAC.1
MHVAIRSQAKICDTFEDFFKLLEELYAALYTSQDNMNRARVKIKRWKNLGTDDLHWDFLAAK